MWDKNLLERYGGTLLAFALVGCGASDDGENGDGADGLDEATVQSFEGQYRLDSFTENPSSCDAEGPSTLPTITERNFVTVGSAFFGQRFLRLVSCLDDCPTKTNAIRTNGSYFMEYSVTLSGVAGPDELTGFEATTGFGMDDRCVEREYVTHELTRTGDTVRVESRTVALEDAPQEDGFCVVEPEKQKKEAEGRPCTALSVFTGTKTGALP